ncbi:MAG: 2-dehydropantoate 2-reductase [Devosia sp.]
MKVLIVGAGAVGGFLAVKLHEGGHEVAVVARGPHLHAIKSHGLTLRAPDGAEAVAKVAADESPERFGAQDLVITTLKAPSLPSIVPRLLPALASGAPLAAAMNGVFWWYGHDFLVRGDEADTRRLDPQGILATIPMAQTLGIVIHSTNEMVAPGVVQNRSPNNRFVMGGPTAESMAHAVSLADALTSAAVSVVADSDIRRVMWRKLLRNLSTAPASVLTGGQAYDVLNDSDARTVAHALFEEGAAVAAAHGFEGLADEAPDVFRAGSGARQKPSMSQDVDRGRPMEIDTILRSVQDFARQCGVATPTLDTVVALVLLRARLVGGYPRNEA